MVKTPFVVWIAVCLAGCASQPRVADSAASAAAGFPACTAPPSPTDTLWREIRAAGFTFCVPASWRSQGSAAGPALDPRTWRSPIEQHYHPSSAIITWGTGMPPTPLRTSTPIDMRARAVHFRRRARAWPPDVRYTELLGGRTAEVSEWRFGGPVYHTEARWRDPAVYLEGETRSEMLAQLLLAIHRTVRFTPAPPP